MVVRELLHLAFLDIDNGNSFVIKVLEYFKKRKWKSQQKRRRLPMQDRTGFYTEGLWAARLDLASGSWGCRQWCCLEQPLLAQHTDEPVGFFIYISSKAFCQPFFLTFHCVWWQEFWDLYPDSTRSLLCVLGPTSICSIGVITSLTTSRVGVPGWQGESGCHQHSERPSSKEKALTQARRALSSGRWSKRHWECSEHWLTILFPDLPVVDTQCYV